MLGPNLVHRCPHAWRIRRGSRRAFRPEQPVLHSRSPAALHRQSRSRACQRRINRALKRAHQLLSEIPSMGIEVYYANPELPFEQTFADVTELIQEASRLVDEDKSILLRGVPDARCGCPFAPRRLPVRTRARSMRDLLICCSHESAPSRTPSKRVRDSPLDRLPRLGPRRSGSHLVCDTERERTGSGLCTQLGEDLPLGGAHQRAQDRAGLGADPLAAELLDGASRGRGGREARALVGDEWSPARLHMRQRSSGPTVCLVRSRCH